MKLLSKMKELMKEVGCQTEEEIVQMMNDPNNQHPLIVDLRELFQKLDSSKRGEKSYEK